MHYCRHLDGRSFQAFHVNPLTWAFRATVLNEFQSPEYGKVCLPEVAEGEECPQDRKLGQVRGGLVADVRGNDLLLLYVLFSRFKDHAG